MIQYFPEVGKIPSDKQNDGNYCWQNIFKDRSFEIWCTPGLPCWTSAIHNVWKLFRTTPLYYMAMQMITKWPLVKASSMKNNCYWHLNACRLRYHCMNDRTQIKNYKTEDIIFGTKFAKIAKVNTSRVEVGGIRWTRERLWCFNRKHTKFW